QVRKWHLEELPSLLLRERPTLPLSPGLKWVDEVQTALKVNSVKAHVHHEPVAQACEQVDPPEVSPPRAHHRVRSPPRLAYVLEFQVPVARVRCFNLGDGFSSRVPSLWFAFYTSVLVGDAVEPAR